jgi:hypothetical protein
MYLSAVHNVYRQFISSRTGLSEASGRSASATKQLEEVIAMASEGRWSWGGSEPSRLPKPHRALCLRAHRAPRCHYPFPRERSGIAISEPVRLS